MRFNAPCNSGAGLFHGVPTVASRAAYARQAEGSAEGVLPRRTSRSTVGIVARRRASTYMSLCCAAFGRVCIQLSTTIRISDVRAHMDDASRCCTGLSAGVESSPRIGALRPQIRLTHGTVSMWRAHSALAPIRRYERWLALGRPGRWLCLVGPSRPPEGLTCSSSLSGPVPRSRSSLGCEKSRALHLIGSGVICGAVSLKDVNDVEGECPK